MVNSPRSAAILLFPHTWRNPGQKQPTAIVEAPEPVVFVVRVPID